MFCTENFISFQWERFSRTSITDQNMSEELQKNNKLNGHTMQAVDMSMPHYSTKHVSEKLPEFRLIMDVNYSLDSL